MKKSTADTLLGLTGSILQPALTFQQRWKKTFGGTNE